ncbi:ATP-binding protein [Pseudophaeobacter arcticus]|uniref:PAS domain-containing hybrid sensor histidine kinase/response regulator n=1 Tax=Pseudophaeobacter arcticus TaxID=385492 RepID=UPI003A97FEED
MTIQGTSGQEKLGSGSLAQHHVRYSEDGLFLRYVRGQMRVFWPRLAFIALVSLALAGLASPMAGLAGMLIAGTAEVIDGTFMRYAYRRLKAGAPSRRLRRISAVTGLLQGIGIFLGAATPYWVGTLFDGASLAEIDPLFAMSVLAGAAINAGLLMPYNVPATVARLSVYTLAPYVLMFSGDAVLDQMEFQLRLGGLVILDGTLLWYLHFVTRSFARTRSILLTQALQQQELEGAYERLLEQQVEAKRLALVARHANDSVLLIDQNNKVQWANEAFTRLTGYSFDEIQGREPGDLLNHPDTNPEALEQILEGRRTAQPFRMEILNRHKDGQDIWLETNQVPIRDGPGGKMSYIAIERDITVAKHNAQQLEEARQAAEEGGRAKSDFLATMSHEIRTPMNGVIGMAQLLEETDLDTDQKLYTNTILSSARTLLALINDILDLSKLDAGQISINPCDFDLHQCFDETIRLLRTQAETKGLVLDVERDADLPRYLHGDDHRLRQILNNLVGNAIKFTEKGRVKVTVESEPAIGGGVMLNCAIIDTGIGIPKEMLTGIFERFSQADAAISRRFGGSGLGLAISRRLAEAMNGRITVTSEIDSGSCFTLSLPFALANPADMSVVPAPEGTGHHDGLSGVRVLVAEDNRVNRLLIQKFLKKTALELEFAHDGSEAVDKAKSFKPDIILMDVSMPVMDGLEATRIIRSWGQPQPAIIALTANAFDTDREDCLAAGMNEFVTKPISRSQLLDVLATFSEIQRVQLTG